MQLLPDQRIQVRGGRLVYSNGEELEFNQPYFQHEANLAVKIASAPEPLQPVIQEVGQRYREWRNQNLAIDHTGEEAAVIRKAELYDEYRRILDRPDVDAFDSRGALQPSALEEFCFYLLKPILEANASLLAIGKYDVFQGMYFTSGNLEEFTRIPGPQYPRGTLDFIVGKKIQSTISTESGQRSETLYVAAVAIECKTYLDRPRFVEADYLAEQIKTGFPNCLFIILSEYLKLDVREVNLPRTEIDKIYVIRRSKNIDRKIRRAKGIELGAIHAEAVVDLYNQVKAHLTGDWSGSQTFEDTGILK